MGAPPTTPPSLRLVPLPNSVDPTGTETTNTNTIAYASSSSKKFTMNSNVSFQQIEDDSPSDSEQQQKQSTLKPQSKERGGGGGFLSKALPLSPPSFLRRTPSKTASHSTTKVAAAEVSSPRGTPQRPEKAVEGSPPPPPPPSSDARGSSSSSRSLFRRKAKPDATSTPPLRTATSLSSSVGAGGGAGAGAVEDGSDEDDDPVMAFFTARNTQKVRFSLGGVEPKERGRESNNGNRPMSPTATSKSNSSLLEGKTMSASFNIKKFMRGALFGGSGSKGKASSSSSPYSSSTSSDDLFELELAKEMDAAQRQNKEMVWSHETDALPEILRTNKYANHNKRPLSSSSSRPTGPSSGNSSSPSLVQLQKDPNGTVLFDDFVEDADTRAAAIKLLNKARRAQYIHYRYSYAVKCYVRALELLQEYPLNHSTVVQTLSSLQTAHFANASYNNSANIVKLGIKYEDAGELVRALKMYTIAYRIRRESLSPTHPSLVVLLNMLGGIQIKRGELDEAMAIYELALKDTKPPESPPPPTGSISSVCNTSANSSSNSSGGGGSDHSSSQSSGVVAAGMPSSTLSKVPQCTNFLTRAVTCREMGTIHEQWGETTKALRMYHKSLDCMAEFKTLTVPSSTASTYATNAGWENFSFVEDEDEKIMDDEDDNNSNGNDSNRFVSVASLGRSTSNEKEILRDLERTRLSGSSQSSSKKRLPVRRKDLDCDHDTDEGGMELTFGEVKKGKKGSPISVGSEVTQSRYDVFFPVSLEQKKRKKRLVVGRKIEEEMKGDHTDVDVALTIHRIAQLHRSQQDYHLALPAFNVALRGMKYALGKSHPNVAAILGNIGNLQKEMGDMDSAYITYQQVLAIESYRLGLSHPDVVVTLHNISTIDAARGNHEHALSLYTQVVSLQRKLFGDDHESVAVTSACMGDVYERLGDTKSAVECYEEALRIKIVALGRHSLEVARLLHKLGKLAVCEEDFHLAHSYISKVSLVYRLNKLRDDDEWVVDVNRDAADVDAAIAMGRGGDIFEC